MNQSIRSPLLPRGDDLIRMGSANLSLDSPRSSIIPERLSRMCDFTQKASLFVAMCALVLTRSIDQVLYYRLTKMYESYIWILGALAISIGNFIFLWPVVWYKMHISKSLTPSQRAFPHKQLMIMASFDALSGILGTWALPYIPGSIANGLSTGVLPLTMAMSLLFLGTKYQMTHYTGGILVVVGMCVCMIPTFIPDPEFPETIINGWIWIPVFLVSLIPQAASNVYKENGLKGFASNVWHVNAWIVFYQLLWGILSVPTILIPWVSYNGEETGFIESSEFFEYLNNGWDCFAYGINNVPTNPDACEGLLMVFIRYIIVNILFNLLMLVVFKNGSSSFAMIASAIRLPLVDVLLLWPAIAGEARDSIPTWSWVALVFLIAGLVVYRLNPEKSRLDPVDVCLDVDMIGSYGSLSSNSESEVTEQYRRFGQLSAIATGFSPQPLKRHH